MPGRLDALTPDERYEHFSARARKAWETRWAKYGPKGHNPDHDKRYHTGALKTWQTRRARYGSKGHRVDAYLRGDTKLIFSKDGRKLLFRLTVIKGGRAA